MATKRKITRNALAGILIAAILIVVGTLTPTVILPAIFPVKAGTIDIKVTDAPVPDLSSLNVTVDEFLVHSADTGQWINLTIVGGQVTFDLVKLNNVTQDAALDQIPAGNYTQIKMHVLSAVAQIDDGDVFSVNFAPNRIFIPQPFVVEVDQTTSIIIDIQVETIKIAENPQNNVSPVIKAMVIPPR